ncbi:MAG: cytochrome b N-terminal domain-containing protein [Bacteroidota bacterium]
MNRDKIYELNPPKVILFDTFGGIAISSLILCILSGIILAIPYDVSKAYLSITQFLLNNPGAVIARNMHYWSAQFFLIFSVLHMWDHLRIGSEKYIRPGVWFRLILSLFVIMFAMLSGFILKADTDSYHALQIFRTLFEGIPLIGKYIGLVLLGEDGTLLLLYINHVALATIFIIVILFEHARIIWGKGITFVVLLLIFLILSFLFHAPLQYEDSAVVKGPWYFLGLQEILHWMKQPAWIWLITLVFIIPIFLLPFLKEKGARIIKYLLLISLIFYLAFTIIGYFFRGAEWKWTWEVSAVHMPFHPVPMRAASYEHPSDAVLGAYGRAESCMLCHENMSGFSEAHDPRSIGCVSCHLGNPFSPDKDQAHAGMLKVPGNLDHADRSCGTADCHPDITSRIHTSLMSTMSGIISVDRFVFNELPEPAGFFNVADIAHSPADQHLRNMCARCHLGNPKEEPGAVTQESRGGGCNACHLNYSAGASRELDMYLGTTMPDSSLWTMHPSLDLNISNDHCFGCHSRSGRISTSFEGWHETLLQKDEVSSSDTLRVLEDGRVFRYIEEDVHHKAGMQCVDCHDSYELMGDGNLYMHEEDQVMIGCEDCHFSALPPLLLFTDLDVETQKILSLKEKDFDELRLLPLGNTGRSIWNGRVDSDGLPFLLGKISRDRHPLNSPAEICRRGTAHDELSCQSCHTSWMPQCIGCHNEYDPRVAGYDMVERKEETGSWVEYVGLYLAGRPTLGVVEGDERRVHTFTPGMILSIDKSGYDPGHEDPHVFHRLYAPLSAHTTTAKGRSCRSCHNEPMALGYGYGVLAYELNEGSGSWSFVPRFAPNEHDGLPEDAWISFLAEPDGRYSTRTNTRPFSLEEQKRILLLGACLECHDENSEIILSTLDDFDKVIDQRSLKCILPSY